MDVSLDSLRPLTRFDQILSLSIEELENLQDRLTPEEIQLFQYNDFYFLYAQHNYPELNLVTGDIYPLDENDRPYSDWREVVLVLEKTVGRSKRVMKKIYSRSDEMFGGNYSLPDDIRLMTLEFLPSDDIIDYCNKNSQERLCSDENSELWKMLYKRDVSEWALPIETESIYVKYYQSDVIPSIAFYKTSSMYSEITYKFCYNLFKRYLKYTEPLKSYLEFLARLGAEKKLSKYPEPNHIIFEEAALNNHFHIVDIYFDKYSSHFYNTSKLMQNLIEGKEFREMAKYLFDRNKNFSVDLTLRSFDSILKMNLDTLKFELDNVMSEKNIESFKTEMDSMRFDFDHPLLVDKKKKYLEIRALLGI